MKKHTQSTGNCVFCKKTFAKAGINRHLQTHLKEMLLNKECKPGKSFYLKVVADWGLSNYFLYLWVSSSTTLRDIDVFLRNIWLECCGHMSTFTYYSNNKNGNFHASFDDDDDDDDDEKDEYEDEEYDEEYDEESNNLRKSWKAAKVFCKGLKLKYEYDFGSTTQLVIYVLDELECEAPESIMLLSRNNPLEIWCEQCKVKPAVTLCIGHDEPMYFCEACGEKHSLVCEDYEEYGSMPVVNSPRMGACAYEGGSIDCERDGPFEPEAKE